MCFKYFFVWAKFGYHLFNVIVSFAFFLFNIWLWQGFKLSTFWLFVIRFNHWTSFHPFYINTIDQMLLNENVFAPYNWLQTLRRKFNWVAIFFEIKFWKHGVQIVPTQFPFSEKCQEGEKDRKKRRWEWFFLPFLLG